MYTTISAERAETAERLFAVGSGQRAESEHLFVVGCGQRAETAERLIAVDCRLRSLLR